MTKQSTIFPDVKAGVTVKIHEKIKETNPKGEEKERIQVFEGLVISRRSGSTKGATIMVRKIAKGGFAVEKIYPIHSPIIDKIEVVKTSKVRRAKLFFTRELSRKMKDIK